MLQKELSQAKKMSELAVSASEQIHRKVEKMLEPKLDELLSRKIKVTTLKTIPHKKKNNTTNLKGVRESILQRSLK